MPMGMPSWKADVLAKVATVTKIRDLAGYSTTVRIYKSTSAPRLSIRPASGDGHSWWISRPELGPVITPACSRPWKCDIGYCSIYQALAFLFAVAAAPVGSFAGGGKKAVAPGLWKLVRLQHHEP